jgi:hypothetical protein
MTLFPPLRPGHHHVNFAAAAFGADQRLAPIEHGRFGVVACSLSAGSGSTWWPQSRHHTIRRTPAAAELPSVAGAPGSDFNAAF